MTIMDDLNKTKCTVVIIQSVLEGIRLVFRKDVKNI